VAPRIAHIKEIVRCDSVAGDIDLILMLETQSPDRLQAIRDEISSLEGVREVVTLPRMIERFAR
jgi:Lrp/AsnC family transcriptional regulator, leucine-responsive regulatory protein